MITIMKFVSLKLNIVISVLNRLDSLFNFNKLQTTLIWPFWMITTLVYMTVVGLTYFQQKTGYC